MLVLAMLLDVIAITGGMIVDGTGAAPVQGTVVMQGDRIIAAGRDVPVPLGAKVIRVDGQTVMPGLFDLHTHLPYSGVGNLNGDWPKNLAAYLLSGVTSVTDFGTYPETFAPMRRLIESGQVQAPHLSIAARFTTPGGHGGEAGRGDFFSLEVLTPREARAAVRKVLPYKPDVIKVFTDGWRYGTAPEMTSMEEATLAALVDEAHKNKLKVLTHTVTLERAKSAARAGVDVLAHGIGNAPVDDELIRIMKAKGTAYVSTLAVYEPRRREVDPLLKRVMDPEAINEVRPLGAVPDPGRVARFDTLLHNVAALQAAGVPMGAGTDAGVTGTYHGWATLRELKLLVRAGLTPMEAITAATRNSARAIAVDRGVIAAGKTADLIVVDGEPYKRIEDIENIRRVFVSGKEMDLDKLAKLIAAPGPAPIASVQMTKATARVDDFESADGRSLLKTLWVNSTDPGHDHSRMLFGRVLRNRKGHALMLMGNMSEKDKPYIRVSIPLRPGGMEPVDTSEFKGVRFDARGAGEYRLIEVTQSARGSYPAGKFSAGGKWKTVKVPLTASDLLMLTFEVAWPAGNQGWLELDNVTFFK
jgi:imidazolonepropionase-like amidohydrolase